jgi:hypothetical protein
MYCTCTIYSLPWATPFLLLGTIPGCKGHLSPKDTWGGGGSHGVSLADKFHCRPHHCKIGDLWRMGSSDLRTLLNDPVACVFVSMQ